MTDITTDDFTSQVLEAKTPVIVDFWAPRCSRCRAMELVLEQVEAEEGVKICRVDVDKEQKLAKKYGVMSLPTVAVFNGGEMSGKRIGLCGKDDISDMLAEA